MNEIDKLIHQLANIQNWLHAGKDNEAIRKAMYESAATVCHQVCSELDDIAGREPEGSEYN